MSLVLPGTLRTNFSSMIQIIPELVLQTYPLFNDSQIILERALVTRTRVTLCRVNNMVLDDVHNMAHLSTTIIVLSSNSIFYLAIPSFKSFLSNLFHFGLPEFRLRKHSDLMILNISIYLYGYQYFFCLSINIIY
jgi:DNA phosphorothioation-dependent restriction protein DptG